MNEPLEVKTIKKSLEKSAVQFRKLFCEVGKRNYELQVILLFYFANYLNNTFSHNFFYFKISSMVCVWFLSTRTNTKCN